MVINIDSFIASQICYRANVNIYLNRSRIFYLLIDCKLSGAFEEKQKCTPIYFNGRYIESFRICTIVFDEKAFILK